LRRIEYRRGSAVILLRIHSFAGSNAIKYLFGSMPKTSVLNLDRNSVIGEKYIASLKFDNSVRPRHLPVGAPAHSAAQSGPGKSSALDIHDAAIAAVCQTDFERGSKFAPDFAKKREHRLHRHSLFRACVSLPVWPSCSTFQYSGLQAERKKDSFQLHVDAKNTGDRAGSEVVQVYLTHPPAASREAPGIE
jgi:hypothetical protein